MRRIVLSLLLLFLMLSPVIGQYPSAYAARSVRVVVNGRQLTADAAPLINQGRVLVPMRAIFEALGAKVDWNADTRTVTGTRGDNQVSLAIGSTRATVKGASVALDASPVIVNGRTMVPVRFVAESLRAAVSWNDGTSTVTVDLQQSDQVLRVGLLAPLTGDVKTFGTSMSNGVNLYLSEHQNLMGGFRVEAVTGDDQNTASQAVSQATKMITQDKVSAIIGCVTSKCSIPLSRVCEERSVPMISPTATNPMVTVEDGNRKKFAFRAVSTDSVQGTIAAKFALQNLHAKTAVIMYDQGNDYSIVLESNFAGTFNAGGGQILGTEAYSEYDTDFSAVLTQIAALHPDILYLPDYYQKVSLIGMQAKKQGITAVFLGGDGWDSPDINWAAMDGGYFTNWGFMDDSDPAMQAFDRSYRGKYNAKPDLLALCGYNAAVVLAQAAAMANSTDPVAIRDALQKLQNVPTPLGTISIDENGNAVMSLVILQLKNYKQNYCTTISPYVSL